MGLIHNIKLCLLYIAVLVALLSFTNNFKLWIQRKAEVNNRLLGTPFYIAHVLDPSVEGYNYATWNRQQWLNWLNNRDTQHANANRNRREPLTQKGINTVIITSPTEFLDAFEGRRYPYTPSVNSRSRPDDNTFWGEAMFYSFVFHRSGDGKTMYVYKCPPMYVATKLIDDVPVHLAKQAKEKDAQTGVKVSKDCVQVA